MQIHYAVVDSAGAVTSIYSSPYRFIQCDEDVTDLSHYYDADQERLLPKKSLPMHVGIDGLSLTLEGLPEGVTVATNGAEIVTDGTALVITYDLPGTYEIHMTGHVEYLDRVEEVTVGDP